MAKDRKLSQQQVVSGSAPKGVSDDGVTRRDVLALLASFGVPAAGVPAAAFAQDPTVVAPKSYSVVFENDRVRVLEYNNRPGLGPCGRGRHYHPAHLDIFLSEFSGEMTHEDGRVTKGKGKTKVGQVAWFEAEWHEVENIDKSATRVLLVELKDANWKPSTG